MLALYRRGDLCTLEEGALIAAVSRRRVMAWLNAAGIDHRRTRALFVAKHRSRAVDQSEGKPPKRRLTKPQMRAIADRAKAEWDRRQASN